MSLPGVETESRVMLSVRVCSRVVRACVRVLEGYVWARGCVSALGCVCVCVCEADNRYRGSGSGGGGPGQPPWQQVRSSSPERHATSVFGPPSPNGRLNDYFIRQIMSYARYCSNL